ncbi:MAG: flavin reductase family protein [Burkholderiales bacterium]|jgi:3-hydroxy-9,10-secoandrosta-1,3,5(10)-triene-9,17-dione monooxygenase reductase component|nr:flavin reductase family protein [Burkholderiales bacterium]
MQTQAGHQATDIKPTADTVDIHEFRLALAQFATGITVVTACGPEGRRVGVTANSFNSVSLHPPLVLWSLANKSSSLGTFQACTHYAVNILTADQQALATHFATHIGDKFEGLDFDTGLGGCVLLKDCLASFECINRSRYQEGDHTILVGEVVNFKYQSGDPLVYHARQYFNGLKA